MKTLQHLLTTVLALMAMTVFLSLHKTPGTLAAGLWYVATSGNDTNDCQTSSTPCASIQAAIDKANPGELVLIASGVYSAGTNPEVTINKDITLSGGWDGSFNNQNDFSTIDGQNLNKGILVQQAVVAQVEHLIITQAVNGIENRGNLTINESIIRNNRSGNGGGIYNNNILYISNSTIENNIADNNGGGINNFLSLTIVNSTISGNQAIQGGGIFNFSGIYQGVVNTFNTTIANNSASDIGGGIENNSGASFSIENTLIGNNHASQSPDCSGNISSGGFNFIGSTAGCNLVTSTGDLVNQNAKIGALEGIPPVHPLSPESPAIDAGNITGCLDEADILLLSDQRGLPRWNRCDIGAYELQPLGFSYKQSDRTNAHPGEQVHFDVVLENPSTEEISSVTMIDDLPDLLTFINGSLTASRGQASYQAGVISWSDTLAPQESITIGFSASIHPNAPLNQPITNTAQVQGGGESFLRSAGVMVEPYLVHCPFINGPCKPLYSDNFNNSYSGWPVEDDGNVLVGYDYGEYRILVRPSEWGVLVRPGFQAADYSVAVDLRNLNNVWGSYGIVFGLADDWSTFYTLEIYPDGWYGLYRWDPSDIVVLSEAYSPAIQQDSATNHIKIERNGASIKAYANGQLLANVTDSTYMGMRYLGVVAFTYDQANLDVRYDNFTVFPIYCPGANSPVITSNNGLVSPERQIKNFHPIEKRHINSHP